MCQVPVEVGTSLEKQIGDYMSNIWSWTLCSCLANCWPHTLSFRRKHGWDFSVCQGWTQPHGTELAQRTGSCKSECKLHFLSRDKSLPRTTQYSTASAVCFGARWTSVCHFFVSCQKKYDYWSRFFLGNRDTVDPVPQAIYQIWHRCKVNLVKFIGRPQQNCAGQSSARLWGLITWLGLDAHKNFHMHMGEKNEQTS